MGFDQEIKVSLDEGVSSATSSSAEKSAAITTSTTSATSTSQIPATSATTVAAGIQGSPGPSGPTGPSGASGFHVTGAYISGSSDLIIQRSDASLLNAGERFTPAYLAESILLPSQSISPNFHSIQLTLEDETIHSGYVETESKDVLTLRIFTGQLIEIPKDKKRSI